MIIITGHGLDACYRLYQATNGCYARVKVTPATVPSGKIGSKAYKFRTEITDENGTPLLVANIEGDLVAVSRDGVQTILLDQIDLPIMTEAADAPSSITDGELVRASGRLYEGRAGEVIDRGPIGGETSVAACDLVATLDRFARSQVQLLAASYERISAQAEINALIGA